MNWVLIVEGEYDGIQIEYEGQIYDILDSTYYEEENETWLNMGGYE